MAEIHYCRLPLPSKLDLVRHKVAVDHALQEVHSRLEARGTDIATGRVTIEADYDVRLAVHSVLVRWEPRS
ncbi:hypothetical protein SEA_VROOMVROOM_58 [Arthrobacter phage VroomVroom]|uniref:Uncharacterized protein n=1 Tax=Arthrobacter phage VroomVroom TaxID=3049371 RepID=A0AA49FB77_9CAUD|nr:hypothetical protein SEA_VROOMVROOM_58 [Arthrobacter phage VroomVroom]